MESIIFASQDEISSKQIKEILDSFKIESRIPEIEEIVDALNLDYMKNDNAFEIIKIAGGYQFSTRKKFAHFVGKLYTETQRKKLSPSAIETLSIIAYKQPITRSDIEFIRGVNVDYIVNSLLERDLICIKGRASGPGRPILYGTTDNFLKVLGLNSLEDLPKLREINEILKNEKIEGITEADIDLFNSINTESNLFSAGTPNPDGASLNETEKPEANNGISENVSALNDEPSTTEDDEIAETENETIEDGENKTIEDEKIEDEKMEDEKMEDGEIEDEKMEEETIENEEIENSKEKIEKEDNELNKENIENG
ncbi:MAG: SMC-Scp complex subunit ScpB [Ignavibacteria bacterium]